MEPDEIKRMIEDGLPDSQAMVDGDGSHFQATVVAAAFAGKSPVQKQQMVYATLGDNITKGHIHALGIKAYTPEEWERAKKLQVS